MPTLTNPIIAQIEDPHALEAYYRSDESSFRTAFDEAFQLHPEALILKVWHERLSDHEISKTPIFDRHFIIMAVLGSLAALVMRILFYLVDVHNIAPINLIFGLFPLMSLYLMLTQAFAKRVALIVMGSSLLLIIYFNLLPHDASQVTFLTDIHLPLVLWLLWGLSHTGENYQDVSSRIAFLKFNGEFLILYILFALVGIALTGITVVLFNLLDVDIRAFYFENIVVMGVAGLAIVASYAVQRYGSLKRSISPLLAKVFSPLVLITLIVYLLAMMVIGKNPFIDRDFLISFNVILIFVLAITIYLITERSSKQEPQLMDGLNLMLIACALLINGVALLAMVFRLSSFGITPNRLVSLIMNILIMLHLSSIGYASLAFLRKKGRVFEIQKAVTQWLPVYGLWALFVIVVFPIIF